MDLSSSSDGSSSSDDQETMMALTVCLGALAEQSETCRQGGSRPGRAGNRDIGRVEGGLRIDRDYFCRISPEPPIFSVAEFERRFTVTRGIYEKVRQSVCAGDDFFVQRTDCCGQQGATTDQKLCAALRLLSSGVAAEATVDYFRMAEPTILETMKRFCRIVSKQFRSEYLRRPTIQDIKSIEKQYAKLGFPACLGCVDCSGWQWANCPVGWQGQYIGKEGKPTLRLEVVSDDSLWIWHIMFGVPGAKNDKSIVNQSTLFNDIRSGTWPPYKPHIIVSGETIDWFYYLSDGIYPRFRIFAKPHPDPTTRKQKLYTASHASARKAVERVFAVLFGQFEVLGRPARLSNVNDLNDIVNACVILHNMIVEERGCRGTAKFRVSDELLQTRATSFNEVDHATTSYEQSEIWRTILDPVESLEDHLKLQLALTENVWNCHGELEG